MDARAIRATFHAMARDTGYTSLEEVGLVNPNAPPMFVGSSMAPAFAYFTGAEMPPSQRCVLSQRTLRVQKNRIDQVGKNPLSSSLNVMLSFFQFADIDVAQAVDFAVEFFRRLQLDRTRIFCVVSPQGEFLKQYSDLVERNVPRRNIVTVSPESVELKVGDRLVGEKLRFYFATPFGVVQIGDLILVHNVRGETHIDSGFSLDYLAFASQGAAHPYASTLYAAFRESLGAAAFVYPEQYAVANHMRSIAALVSDGVMPSARRQGRVLRSLIRLVLAEHDEPQTLPAPAIEAFESLGYQSNVSPHSLEQLLASESESRDQHFANGISRVRRDILKSGQLRIAEWEEAYGLPRKLIVDVAGSLGVHVSPSDNRLVDTWSIQYSFERHPLAEDPAKLLAVAYRDGWGGKWRQYAIMPRE